MPVVPVMCSCGVQLPSDESYMKHLQSAHGTIHPDQVMQTAVAIDQNTPPISDLPQNIAPTDLPSPELQALVAEGEARRTQQQREMMEPVGEKKLSDEDKKKMKEMGIPDEVETEPEKPKKGSKTPSGSKVDLQPLELIYRYVGQHKCGSEIDTHMIKAKGLLIAVGWCNNCQKQVKSIEVNPIRNDVVESS